MTVPHTPQQVRMNIGGEPGSLDPRKTRDLQGQNIARMFFEGLTRVNRDEKIELSLAKEVAISEDGMVYTFVLKEASWSNGDPITVHDFIYAWKQILSPDFPAEEAFLMYPIKNSKLAKEGKVPLEEVGITALDDHTLRIELETPTPYFLDLLSSPIFSPVNHKVDLANPNWAKDVTSYVCNGPFKPKEWRHSDCIEAVKNPKYWDASSVRLQRIELVMVNESVEWLMFEKKELDWAGSPISILPLDSLPRLKEDKMVHTKPYLATYFVRTNTQRPPFNHPLMRKAFSFALNRADMIEHLLHSSQISATSFVPPCFGLQEDPCFTDGDISTARAYFDQALAELELNRDQLSRPVLIYIAGDRNRVITQSIQRFWSAAFGIDVVLQPVERKVYFDRLAKMDFHLAISSWSADFNDPINFLQIFHTKNCRSNNTGWENRLYQQLIDRSISTPDPKDRRALLQASEQILIESMPIIPIFHYNMLFLKDDQLKDVVISNLGGIDFKWAYREGV